jgi:wyosine [tRNA(Phe)-imidazoG37] synthetase (radical SAM superfamily)
LAEPVGTPVRPETTAFGCRRDFLGQRFVYAVISPRAGGLSVGINMNPDKFCNFQCVYCEVNRAEPAVEPKLDVGVMVAELERTLEMVHAGRLVERANYRGLPVELLKLRHVALSGDGEPTLSPNFGEIVEKLVHLRACNQWPFFKLALITNASGFDREEVSRGLGLLTPRDEIWAKLESGTQEHMDRVNKADRPLAKILANILLVARERPVIIQSLFPAIDREGPAAHEIESFAQRLKELREAGAQIPLVQIHSATRPPARPDCGHLPLRTLSLIARRVREVSGLKAEVF